MAIKKSNPTSAGQRFRAVASFDEVTTTNILNTYDLVSSDYVVITKDAIKKIEEGNK